jgi:ATP-dependent Clp protease ATP-binding subunit ClpC
MTQDEFSKIAKIDEKLKKQIIGQDEVVEKVASAIKRARVGVSDPNKPMASFMFLGPTGVGKTELARKIAEEVFDRKDALVKIDMSELMESHAVSKLIGSPPGYVGYEEGGSLTEKIRRNPYSVVLFDEVEKASADILNILLQILDEGKLTDSRGNEVNFKNTIIILTSNIGAQFVKDNPKIGFDFGEKKENKKEEDKMAERISSLTKRYFAPEFLNRLDETLIFKPLTKDNLLKILDLEFSEIKKRLEKNNFEIEVDDKIFEKIIDDKYNFEFGARPLKRLLQEKILNPLSEEILKTGKQEGKLKISLDKKGELKFDFQKEKKAKTPKNSKVTKSKIKVKKLSTKEA